MNFMEKWVEITLSHVTCHIHPYNQKHMEINITLHNILHNCTMRAPSYHYRLFHNSRGLLGGK